MEKSFLRNSLETLLGTKRGTNILLAGILIALVVLVLLLAAPGFLSLLVVGAIVFIIIQYCGRKKGHNK